MGEAISGKEGLEENWNTCGFLHTLIHPERVEKWGMESVSAQLMGSLMKRKVNQFKVTDLNR